MSQSSAGPLFPAADPQAVAALRVRLQRGDRQAAIELLRPYEQPVYQVLRSLVVVEGEAVELASQVFTAAWRGLADQPSSKPVLPWLLGLTVSHVRAFGRKERRGQHLDERLVLLLAEALHDRPTTLAASYALTAERLAGRVEQARTKLGAGAVDAVAFHGPVPLDLLALAEARAASAGPARVDRRSLFMPVLGALVLGAALIWYFTARPGLELPVSGSGALAVTHLEGEAWRWREGGPRPLSLGEEIGADYRVATGGRGALTLEMTGLRLALGADTSIDLLAVDDAGATLRLKAGELSARTEGVSVVVSFGDTTRHVEFERGQARLSDAPQVMVETGRAMVREGRRVMILAEGEQFAFAWSAPAD